MADQPLLLSCFCLYHFLEETLRLCLTPTVILFQHPLNSNQCISTVLVLPSHWWRITSLIYSVILASHNGPLKQIIWATNLWKMWHFNWLLAFDHMPVPHSFIPFSNRMNIHAHLLRFWMVHGFTIQMLFVGLDQAERRCCFLICEAQTVTLRQPCGFTQRNTYCTVEPNMLIQTKIQIIQIGLGL